MKHSLKLRWMAMLAMLALMAPLSSFAYIPPAHFILDRMMKAREGLKALELVGEVRDLQRNVNFQETLRLDFTGGRFWSTLTDSTGAVAAVHSGKLVDLKSLGQAWIELGYDPSEYRFREAMQVQKVWPTDKTETRLVREANKVQWAWGQEQQIRIEKDQFVWAGFQDAEKNEVTVKEQARFPRLVIVRAKGQDKFQYHLKAFKINSTPKEIAKWASAAALAPQGNFIDPVREWVALVR